MMKAKYIILPSKSLQAVFQYGAGSWIFHLLTVLVSMISFSSTAHADFDRLENWGFEQGGGYRQGNFVGEDSELVVVDTAWDATRSRLAVSGALGSQWAVRVYTMEEAGPTLVASWNGDSSVHHATASTLCWVAGTGRLVSGVEHLIGNRSAVRIVTLDPENNETIEFTDLPGWESVTDLQEDPANEGSILVLGAGDGLGKCLSFNPESRVLSNQFGMSRIEQPAGMAVVNGQVWIGGQFKDKGRIEMFINGKFRSSRSLGRDFFISEIEASGDRIYLTGRCYKRRNRLGKIGLEDFFLVSMRWSGRSIKEEWSVLAKDVENGRETGTSLLAMPDGGVVVGGDFGKSWMLGQSDPFAKLAVLSSGGNEGGDFDSFLARYDREGNLLWAQSSGLPGNDFPVDLAALDANSFMLLGNRKTGSGFGPYLSRIGMSGEQTKNAPLVSPGAEDLKEISLITWEPPATLRFGEPIEGNYLSARALGKASFQYEINGSTVDTGDIPLFQPGDVNMTARLFRGEIESNTTTVNLTGLKGRPYLKLGFVQNEGVLHLSHEFFGLHPAHLTDSLKLESMAQGMSYERVGQDGNDAIKEASLTVDSGFTGSLEIMGTFEGDKHYEATSRRIVLEMRNGRVFAAGDQGVVRLQVKDLDGWQGDRIVSKGAEAQISATQGFGTNRKFNRWVEFSEENQKLRTARVQSPFNIRTSLLAEEDMTLFAHYNFTFVGTAINGYLAGSRVFLDYNLNGVLDEEEPFGFSTENGGFELEVTEESIQSNDRNGNGMIDPAEGMLVVLEGVDHSSKLPLSISYRAPPNYSVITSISTMVAELVEEGQSMADAESLVVQYLSLPGDIELSSFEPLQEVFKRGEKAQGFTLRATQLSNLLNEGSRFLQMKTGGKLNRVRGAELIVTTLKDKILAQAGRRSAGINESLDLVDSSLLLDVITEAETQAIKETGQIENFVIPPGSSVREELANIQPDIAEIGNTSILNQMVEQVSSANIMLNELNDNPNVDPAAFKALASASQSILDELGETSANTIFEDEVSTLSNVSASDSLAALDILDRVTETKALPVNNELPQSISLEKFSLNALEEFSSKAEINVFAPVLTTSEIISPQDLNDELALGKFSAIDPEGKEIIYSIVGENPDFDLDGQSIFSIDPGTGQIQIRDFDDLRLMNRDTLEPIVRVTDLKGLFRDEKVVINLTEWTYLAGRLQLTDLALTLAENLPVGTIVHQFNPADSQGDKIDYLLVSGKGDNDNTLFTLQIDGTLQTNKVFDFESTPSNFEVRVQARDSRNNTAERSFTIQVTDIIVPNVQTGRARILADGSLQLEGTISGSGDVGNQLKRGFLFGRNPITDINDPGLSTISAGTGKSVTFSTLLESDGLGGGYSFIAFAENQEGINYGVEQEFTLPRITPGDGWSDGMQLGDSNIWWRSDWFGLFYTELYPWIYHQNLGWVFVNVESTRGAWLYHERLGWVWTMPEIFPSLFMAKRNEWTYVDTTREKTTMYDYINQAWFEPDTPISILGKALPENGGEIKGLGSYYRWDPVTLEAKPAANFNFGGWSGDLSGVQKTHIFEAIRNMELEASFIPLPSPGTSGKEVVSGAAKALDKMDLTETEKKKSMAELLIFGKSKTSGLSIDGSE